MAGNIPNNEKQSPVTKTTQPSEVLNKNGRPNKEFPRQKKAERIHLHQTSTATYTKGTALRGGRKRVRKEHKYKEGKMKKYLSIITLNVNGLNAPIKRHRVALAGVAQ